jgi:2'-5' RNA ligase
MNIYRLPAYIVFEIPPPIRGVIQSIRDSLATLTSHLPVEITVAGSSGTGPIPAGTNKNQTEIMLKSALADFKPFRARFEEIRCFPNSNVFYLAPEDRQPFDLIHLALKASGITFGQTPWPYNPHCTLRAGPMTDHISTEDILNLSFPKQEFVIDTVSIYELDGQSLTCHRSFQAKLKGQQDRMDRAQG